jgi:beta-glucanase (GH16 family)
MPRIAARAASVTALVAAGLSIALPAEAAHKPAPTKTTTTTAAAAAVTSTTPLRIIASPSQQLDITGATWQPDAPYARGGTLTSTLLPIARTGSAVLYQHARVGVTDYAIPVATPGTYFVDMFASETGAAQPGQRVWSASAEGKQVATVDVARDAGQATAYHVLFAVPVTDGTLNLHLTPMAGQPVVDSVEVDYEKASTTPATQFDDEFDGIAGSSPSSSRWGFAYGGNGWGNNELESYTARPSNAALDGAGNLNIVARKETYTGSDGITRNYTSARLTTRNTFTFQYGSATARVRTPAGAGLLPAFWALGSDSNTVAWPQCGEMDIAENLGSEPTTVHETVHAALTSALTSQWLSGVAATSSAPLADDFHTYGLVWGPNAMSMSLDGRTYFTLSTSDMSPTSQWDFNHPFFLLLNLAVGGNWAGSPTAATAFPAVMSVDYVRVTS